MAYVVVVVWAKGIDPVPFLLLYHLAHHLPHCHAPCHTPCHTPCHIPSHTPCHTPSGNLEHHLTPCRTPCRTPSPSRTPSGTPSPTLSRTMSHNMSTPSGTPTRAARTQRCTGREGGTDVIRGTLPELRLRRRHVAGHAESSARERRCVIRWLPLYMVYGVHVSTCRPPCWSFARTRACPCGSFARTKACLMPLWELCPYESMPDALVGALPVRKHA